jgi:hypothetical protein
MHYTLQYERMAQHENGRIQVSNYVVAASIVSRHWVKFHQKRARAALTRL